MSTSMIVNKMKQAVMQKRNCG
ncbi:hypothetical protein [uncultured Tolumonas sp.]|nr:hypothetical protein [uncultured Tolumonas sp.]